MTKEEALQFISEGTPDEILEYAVNYVEDSNITKLLRRGYKCNHRMLSDYRGAAIVVFKAAAREALGIKSEQTTYTQEG